MKRPGGLGRLPAPDPRDQAYPIRAMLPRKEPERTYRYWWANGWHGDQGSKPWCVAYSWLHYLEDGPFTQKGGAAPIVQPKALYERAQDLDEWAGSNYDGTSVRGGAKALEELGFIAEYRWAWDADTVVKALLQEGPVVVGTYWYEGMDRVGTDGYLRPTGVVLGGHAYVLNGVNTKTRRVRCKNSWGRSWGMHGFAWIDFDDLDGLIKDDGEAALAVEKSP